MAAQKIIDAGGSHTDGVLIGLSGEKVGLFGVTPVVQPANADQAALTDNSGGTASDTIAAIGVTYDQAEVRNAIASLAAKINMLRRDAVLVGSIKGSA